MAYDPNTVIQRYQQMLDLPEGEATESSCAFAAAGAGDREALGCPPEGCQSCCVGVVEMVRQYSERAASLETRSIEFEDTTTLAKKLEQK